MHADRIVDGIAYRVAVVVFQAQFLLFGRMRLQEVGAHKKREHEEHKGNHHVRAAHHHHHADKSCS